MDRLRLTVSIELDSAWKTWHEFARFPVVAGIERRWAGASGLLAIRRVRSAHAQEALFYEPGIRPSRKALR